MLADLNLITKELWLNFAKEMLTFFSRSEIVKHIAAKLLRALSVPWLMAIVVDEVGVLVGWHLLPIIIET